MGINGEKFLISKMFRLVSWRARSEVSHRHSHNASIIPIVLGDIVEIILYRIG
jgi:hypothetical protein